VRAVLKKGESIKDKGKWLGGWEARRQEGVKAGRLKA
jgi:allantoicase